MYSGGVNKRSSLISFMRNISHDLLSLAGLLATSGLAFLITLNQIAFSTPWARLSFLVREWIESRHNTDRDFCAILDK